MIQTVGKVLRRITHAQVANCVNHSVKVLMDQPVPGAEVNG